MITDKVTHLFNFNKSKSTSNDPLANSVVLNTNLVGTRSTALDAYANNVVLNIRFDQALSSFFFLDDCGNSITRTSGSAIVSPTVKRSGYPVCYFDGTNDFFIIQYATELNLQKVDFTVETWARIENTTGDVCLFDFRGTATTPHSWVLGADTTNKRIFIFNTATATYTYTSNNSYTSGNWFHLAVCSVNNICKIYVNGSSILEFYFLFPATNVSGIKVGEDRAAALDLLGYMSDIRITRGVSRYTDNFTPPVSIPEVTPRGPRVSDQILGDCYTIGGVGPALEYTSGPFGGPALYFNGSTFLTMPYSKYFDIFDQSSPFTLELWFKIEKNSVLNSASTREGTLIAFGWPDSGSVAAGLSIRVGSQGSANIGAGIVIEFQNSSVIATSVYQYPLEKGTWHHFAMCKKSRVDLVNVFIDGKQIKPNVDHFPNFFLANFTTTLPIKIGSDNFTNYVRGFVGWMTDLRITRECRYFGNFAVPTASYNQGDSYLADTSLLMRFDDTAKTPQFGLTNDAKGHSVTATNDVGLISGGRFGGTCAYFDGTGDKLAVAYTSDMDITTGPFTFEFWYRPGSIAAVNQILIDWRSANNLTGFNLWQQSTSPNKISVSIGNSNTSIWEVEFMSTTLLEVDRWYHIAITKGIDNQISLWIDGRIEGTTIYTGAIYINSAPLWIGVDRAAASSVLASYDNLRLTKDVSRYLAPPLDSPVMVDSYTKLLLNFNGTDGSSTFTDSSSYNHTVSVVGTTHIETDRVKYGSASGYFDGINDHLTVPYSNFKFNENYGIDGWVYALGATNRAILTFRNTSNYNTPVSLILLSTNVLQFLVGNTSWLVNITSTATILSNCWNHFAIQKVGSDYEIYINGLLDTRTTVLNVVPALPNYDLKIGLDPGASYRFAGYMDDLRLVDGAPIISQNFTPPTSAYSNAGYKTSLLLHFDGNNGSTIINDECGHSVKVSGNAALSTTQSKFGTASAYFDGTGDYLTIITTRDMGVGYNSDFTIEMWIYPTVSSSTYKTLFSIPFATHATLYFRNSYITWYDASAERCISANITTNAWHHVAVVRVGSVIDVYVDGVKSSSSYTSTAQILSNVNFFIGCNSSGTEPYTGYIDEVRVIKGKAVYTANFTPPTSALSIDSSGDVFFADTALLMHMDGTDDSTTFTDVKGNTVTAFGNARIKTTKSKFGTASAYFDGTGDYLTFPNATQFDLSGSAKEFTIEAWINFTSVAGTQAIISKDNGASSYDWCILATASTLTFTATGTTITLTVNTPTFKINTWYHIAFVRTSGMISFFVNGILQGWMVGAASHSYTLPIAIGCTNASGTPINFFNGYIDELRITRNVYQYLPYLPPSSERTFMDPLWANTVLMIPFTGANNSTTFTEMKGKTVTANGDAKISTAQSMFGGSSGVFDGSDYLRIEDHADFDLGSGDFTIEFYVYFNSLSETWIGLVQKRWDTNNQNSFLIYHHATDKLAFIYSTDGGAGFKFATLNDTPLQINRWYHLAFTRSGANFDVYINSVKQTTTRNMGTDAIYTSTQPLIIGNYWNSGTLGNGLNGYIDNFQIVKGSARQYDPSTSLISQVPSAPFPNDSTDPNWNDVVLLLPFDEMNQFNDIMNKHDFTPIGNVEISSTQSKFGGLSARFKGLSYLTTPHREDLNFRGDFTIEGWIRAESITGTQIILRKPDDTVTYPYPAYEIRLNGASIQFTVYKSNAVNNEMFLNQTFGTVSLNTWHHFAIVRMGNIWKGFLDGAVGWTGYGSVSHYLAAQNTLPMVIGGDSVNRLFGYFGYLDDFRITLNVARYSAAFTPPASAHDSYGSGDSLSATYPVTHIRFNNYADITEWLDEKKGAVITANGNTAIVFSTISKFGGSCAYFDGSGDYLSIPHSTDLSFGTGDFTIEAWHYPTIFSTAYGMLCTKGAASDGFALGTLPTTGYVRCDINGVGYNSTTAETLNAWNHVAITRSGTTLRLFLNGTVVLTDTNSYNFSDTAELRIGRGRGSSTDYLTGYLQDLRITKGVARYTADFTAPTESLPNETDTYWANTSLLMHMNRTARGIFDENGHALTLNGSVLLSPTNSKWGGVSAYFDGTGYITSPTSSDFQLGTGDFTIEMWIRLNLTAMTSGWETILQLGTDTTNGVFSLVRYSTSSPAGIRVDYYNTGWFSALDIADAGIQNNTWHHIALTRQSNVFRFFVDGVSKGNNTLTTNYSLSTFTLGARSAGNLGIVGYIDDFRMTKGYARYTADFTAPTQPFPAFTNNPNANYELIHLPLSGIRGQASPSYVDIGPSKFTLTASNMTYSNTIIRFPRVGFPAYFNGTSSKLTFNPGQVVTGVNSQTVINFQKDWTIEFWMHPTSVGSSARTIFSFDGQTSVHGSHCCTISTASKLVVNLAKDSAPTTFMALTSTASIVANVWTHILINKKDSYLSITINGTFDSGLILTEQPEPPNRAVTSTIGCLFSSTEFFVGYLQDFVMYYTYSPSVSTNKLGYQLNTVSEKPIVRCSFEGADDSTIFVDSVGYTQITANGSAVISTDDKKFGSSSAYFTGSSDYISIAPIDFFIHGERDFGLEMWLKTTETAGGEQVIFSQPDSLSTRKIIVKFGGVSEGHKLMVNIGDPLNEWVTTSLTKTSFSTAFKHLQIQKTAFSFSVFVDGVCVGSSRIDLGQALTRMWDTTLLHCNGTDNSTTFTDSSNSPKTWTANGNARIRTSSSKFGSSSAYFDGNGDYIQNASATTFNFVTSDFTIECWVNIQADSTVDANGNKDAAIFAGGSTGGLFVISGNTAVTGTGLYLFEQTRAKTIISCTFAQVLTKNQWYHIAVTRERGTVFRLFLDGVLQMEAYDTGNCGSSAAVASIGGNPNGGSSLRYLNGFIDELRISKGLCRYTKSFTVPTAQFLDSSDYLLFSTPSHVRLGGDGTNGFKGYIDEFQIYHGNKDNRGLALPTQVIPNNSNDIEDLAINSVLHNNRGITLTNEQQTSTGIITQNRMHAYFDGIGSLTIEKGPDDWFEFEDFTIEMWVYHLDVGTIRTLVTTRATTTTYSTFILERLANNTVSFSISRNGSSWTNTIATSAQLAFTWYHIAVVRFKETITLYQDGTAVASTNIGTVSLTPATWESRFLNIGTSETGYNYYGYMKGFQFVRGYAKYLTSFTPSTVPLSLFYVDYYNKPLASFFPAIISHYRLGETSGSLLVDCDSGWNLTCVNPASMSLNQAPLVPYNNEKDGSITFNGGYGSGSSQSVAGKQSLTFNFYIKTTSSSGVILEKTSSYLINIVGGKIQATFYFTGATTLTATSITSINDGITHQITVILLPTLIEILIDGILDVVMDSGIIQTVYKNSELLFDGASKTTMVQLRCNDGLDDCKNQVIIQGGVEPVVLNDSPFGTKSLYFNNNYHLEIPGIHFSRFQTTAATYTPTAIDFTVEFWIKVFIAGIAIIPIVSSGCPLSSTGAVTTFRTGFAISLENDYITIRAGNSHSGSTFSTYAKKGTLPIPLQDWTHVAVTCNNQVIKLYQDGIEQTTAYISIGSYGNNSLVNCNVFTSDPLNIGGQGYNKGIVSQGIGVPFRASQIALDDIRISRGVIYG